MNAGGGKCAKAAGWERHVYIIRTSQVSFDDCQQRSRFRDGNSRLLLARFALRTDVTSSRDIPRTWHLRYLDERERQIDREREGRGEGEGATSSWIRSWEQDPRERLWGVLSWRPRAWGCWLMLFHTDHAHNQPPSTTSHAYSWFNKSERLTFKSAEIGF